GRLFSRMPEPGAPHPEHGPRSATASLLAFLHSPVRVPAQPTCRVTAVLMTGPDTLVLATPSHKSTEPLKAWILCASQPGVGACRGVRLKLVLIGTKLALGSSGQ